MGDAPNDQPVDASADLAAGTDVGGYVIEAKIGEGGMGLVYSAKQPRIGKRVAIKILARAFCGDPEVVARFEQEARVVNEIKHPNIVDIFHFGELSDKRSYFVMEWLDGEPLTTRIDRGAIPATEAMEILDVICDALQAAHEHNVIHRDLKSDNVFLITHRNKRTVKLLDFGLAKLSGKGLEDAPVGATKQGIVVGTPAYMSPEQARSQPVDGRTDVYALGVLAYKMLTGILPFRGENAMDLIVQQLNAPPPQAIKLAPKTPPALSKIVVKMMAKAPADRPTLAQIRALFAELNESEVPRRESLKAKRPTGKQAPVQERQEPSLGRARLSMPDLEGSPDRDSPQPKTRATAILLFAAVVLAGVIGTVVVMLVKKSAAPTVEVAAAGSTGSAGSSAGSAGSAVPVALMTPDAAATIEFEDDAVGTGSAAGPTEATNADAARKRRQADDEATDQVNEGTELPSGLTKPGKIFVMLEHASMIEIDGKVVAQSAQGGTYEVPPGDHTLKVSTPNRAPVVRSVHVDPGGSAVIRIADEGDALAPAPTPAPAPTHAPAPAPAEGSAAE